MTGCPGCQALRNKLSFERHMNKELREERKQYRLGLKYILAKVETILNGELSAEKLQGIHRATP